MACKMYNLHLIMSKCLSEQKQIQSLTYNRNCKKMLNLLYKTMCLFEKLHGTLPLYKFKHLPYSKFSHKDFTQLSNHF